MNQFDSNDTPVVRFLGEHAGLGGPFVLLGVSHSARSIEEVLIARDRRLVQVEQHPQRSTPDADEVRLAIHAAAAQLADPALHNELVNRWPEGNPVEIPKAWRSKGKSSKISKRVIASARLIIASSGGWNSTARKRLAYFARVQRFSVIDLISNLQPKTNTSNEQNLNSSSRYSQSTKPSSSTGLTPQADRVISEIGEPRGHTRGSMYFLLTTLCASVVSLVLITRPISQSALDTQASNTQDPVSDTEEDWNAKESAKRTSQREPVEPRKARRDQFEHYSEIIHELEQVTEHFPRNPSSAIERFAKLHPVLVEQWSTIPRDDLNRVGELCIQILEYAHTNDQIEQLLSIIDHQMSSLSKADASGVIFQRTLMNLLWANSGSYLNTQSMIARIYQSYFNSTPGADGDLVTGLIVSIGLEGDRRSNDHPDWWGSWIRAYNAVADSESNKQSILILSALHNRLSSNRSVDKEWESTSKEFVALLDWRTGSLERALVLQVFDDPQVSTSRLAILLDAIITHSSATDVDATMFLPRDASNTKRKEVAIKFQQAWADDFSSVTDDLVRFEIVNQIIDVSNFERYESDPIELSRELVKVFELNTQFWVGLHSDDLSQDRLSSDVSIDDESTNIVTPSELMNRKAESADKDLAIQILSAEDETELLFLLDQIPNEGPGYFVSKALISLAIRKGGTTELRALVLQRIKRHADQLPILVSVDHALVRAERISSRLDKVIREVLIIELPSRMESSYFNIAHAALLEEIVQQSVFSEHVGVDEIQISALNAFRDRLLALSNDPHDQLQVLKEDNTALGLINEFYSILRTHARSFDFNQTWERSYDQVHIELIVRQSNAMTDIERFVAFQSACVDLLALETRIRFPESRAKIHQVDLDRADLKQESHPVLIQILINEYMFARYLVHHIESEGLQK